MGGIKFGWLTVRVPNPDWLCRILELCGRAGVAEWLEARTCEGLPRTADVFQ